MLDIDLLGTSAPYLNYGGKLTTLLTSKATWKFTELAEIYMNKFQSLYLHLIMLQRLLGVEGLKT